MENPYEGMAEEIGGGWDIGDEAFEAGTPSPSSVPGRTATKQQCSRCGNWCLRRLNMCPTCQP